jgi:hypothetical protein
MAATFALTIGLLPPRSVYLHAVVPHPKLALIFIETDGPSWLQRYPSPGLAVRIAWCHVGFLWVEAALRYVKVGLAVGNCSGLLNAPAGS